MAIKKQYDISVDYKTNLFRSLTGKEDEAVIIMDNRDIFTKDTDTNNDVLIVCDHTVNDLKFLKGTQNERHMEIT